jgi:hypothetical protein
MNARTLDHLVLPVGGLGEARVRLGRLGFTVASDARHPFGTENACVFLADGVYLEPLAVGDEAAYVLSAEAGNVFTARDRRVRRLSPDCGLSAIVLASDDAVADDRHYGRSGLSAGDILEFSRNVRLPDGGEATASFRLAFAAAERSPRFFLFSCQRIDPLPRDMGGLVRHANGVSGVREIVLSAVEPREECHLLETVLNVKGEAEGGVMVFNARNGIVRVLPEEAPAIGSGDGSAGTSLGLRGRGIVFSVADLAVTAAVLAANDVPFLRRESRLCVPDATGQDVVFAFEE